jgi:membrane fusion protein (multidrug efflux system)
MSGSIETKPNKFQLLIVMTIATIIFYACKSSADNAGGFQMPPQELPVITVGNFPATTYQEFTASLQGRKDVEIRSQVDGYLDAIYVDEGSRVRKGQSLFRINDRPYREQLNNAKASSGCCKSKSCQCTDQYFKLTPLVQEQCDI